MVESGTPQRNKFFATAMPESTGPIRHPVTDASQPPAGRSKPAVSPAELRLKLWSELPDRHRDEVCRQMRSRCEGFIASARVDRREQRSETDKLLSEVIAHLLRATSLGIEETPMDHAAPGANLSQLLTEQQPWFTVGTIELSNPGLDARVTWIVNETCNRQALLHRYEDTRRRDRGGKWDGTGYPLVAVDSETMEHLGGRYDPTEEHANSLTAEDSRRAWQGLIELTSSEFGPDDDVVALIQILAQDHDTREIVRQPVADCENRARTEPALIRI